MLAPDPRFAEIDALDGEAFELALVELFEILGFEDVQRIGGFDKGADITFRRDGKKVAVQAKRYKGAVGIDAVRQLIDGKRRYACDSGMVVTNSFFTNQAVECAQEWGITLWDRRDLSQFVEGDEPVVDHHVCAECGVAVSEGVTRWCLDQPARYLGNVYCRKHQRRSARRTH